MIITCASCLTKFHLDDSRISAKGVKVRCSRCKHVFYVVPPPETREEIIESAESFAQYHEKLMGPGEKREEVPPVTKAEKEEIVREEEEEEETFLFSEKTPTKKEEKRVSPEMEGEEVPLPQPEKRIPVEEKEIFPPAEGLREKEKPERPKSFLRAERRGPSRFFAFIVVLVLVVFGIFYVWSELSTGGRLSPYLEYPVKKVTEIWNQIWGIEKQDLIIEDLNRYDEKIGETPLFIIEGKVKNQSQFTKKHIKVKVVIFDRDRLKVAEKSTLCGRIISREALKRQPVEFFSGEMVVAPQNKQDMMIPSGKAAPFMVIFKELPSQAKEFKVEIVEAPNL